MSGLVAAKSYETCSPFQVYIEASFPLCRNCVEESAAKKKSKTFCKNYCNMIADMECDRAFWGTLVTVEPKLALVNGYWILYVLEIWTWNREKQTNHLFKK